MRILATFPGKVGDILWALSTVRALSEAYDTPVDLQLSAAYGSGLAPLLIRQPYVGAVHLDEQWAVQDTAPMTPRIPPACADYGEVYHLGYEGWPHPTLAEDIYRRVGLRGVLDLDRPWITTTSTPRLLNGTRRVWVAWSEEWFELKVGILTLIAARFPEVEFWWLRPVGGRYSEAHHFHQVQAEEDEAPSFVHGLGSNVTMLTAGWVETALAAQACEVYLGCLSSQWVLANALGKDVIAVEPNPNRHHPVFWRESPRNHLVLGNDGKPTHDARHVGDALQTWLERKGG